MNRGQFIYAYIVVGRSVLEILYAMHVVACIVAGVAVFETKFQSDSTNYDIHLHNYEGEML